MSATATVIRFMAIATEENFKEAFVEMAAAHPENTAKIIRMIWGNKFDSSADQKYLQIINDESFVNAVKQYRADTNASLKDAVEYLRGIQSREMNNG